MKKIFITGAAGCIGHYLLDRLLNRADLELHLLVRSKSRFLIDVESAKNVVIHRHDMADFDAYKHVLADMDYVVHIATSWGSSKQTYTNNIDITHAIFNACDPEKLQRIVYFSTASILGPENKPLAMAEMAGSGYVRSKYLAYQGLKDCAVKDKVVTVFPTLVFGGDETHPFTHISGGVRPNLFYLKILRFFSVEFTYHFMHSKDIAAMTEYALFNSKGGENWVLGHNVVTAKETLRQLCKAFKIPFYFAIPVAGWFILFLSKLLRIKLDSWTRYLISNPHFEYDVINPQSVGMTPAFPDLGTLLSDLEAQAQHGP